MVFVVLFAPGGLVPLLGEVPFGGAVVFDG